MRNARINLTINNKRTQTFRNEEYLDAILNSFFNTKKYGIKTPATTTTGIMDSKPRVVTENYRDGISQGNSLFEFNEATLDDKLVQNNQSSSAADDSGSDSGYYFHLFSFAVH